MTPSARGHPPSRTPPPLRPPALSPPPPPPPAPERSGSTGRPASAGPGARTTSLVRTPCAEQEQTARTARCAEEDTTKAARPGPAAHRRAEVTGVPAVSGLRVMVLTPRRRVRLHSRPHIDLQRVAGALCRP
ncbi:putative leader peptide [Streptomyces sp. NPDC056785]|uniref:putative leader peptide n=1 Tax=Streptomyces sp. NPDC056785 TaxID=3345944 RepID=UPI0036C4F5EF